MTTKTQTKALVTSAMEKRLVRRTHKPVPARVDSKGRISIPAKWRKSFKLEPGDTLFILQQGQDLVLRKVDPVLLALQNAPFDDEPITEEDREAFARARQEITNGEGIPDEELPR